MPDLDELCDAVSAATTVVPVGGRTQWEVGGVPPATAVEVRAPSGVEHYDPADLTIRVNAGTTVAELDAVLEPFGQECPLDPASPAATVGGVIATGLSGLRRLRYGPVRDRVLEVRFVTADGACVKGGGPTVKNVSGYDLPRLLIGSLGTIGVLTQVVLRCQPRPRAGRWVRFHRDPFGVRAVVLRPSCIAWDGATTTVLLEGERVDVDADLTALRREFGPVEDAEAPSHPRGPHRGRISVPPSSVGALVETLPSEGLCVLAEIGVGTVHVAAEHEPVLAAARADATGAGGWLLRESGAPGLHPFGCDLPHAALQERVRRAFDPTGKLSPGRYPEPRLEPRPEVEVESV